MRNTIVGILTGMLIITWIFAFGCGGTKNICLNPDQGIRVISKKVNWWNLQEQYNEVRGEACAYCQSQGKKLKIIEQETVPFSFGDTGHINITYKCVLKK